jgi:hypothetical protein
VAWFSETAWTIGACLDVQYQQGLDRHWVCNQTTQRDDPMSIKQFTMDFMVMFAIVLVVNLIVTFLYGLIVHGSGVLDWESAFTFALSLGYHLAVHSLA